MVAQQDSSGRTSGRLLDSFSLSCHWRKWPVWHQPVADNITGMSPTTSRCPLTFVRVSEFAPRKYQKFLSYMSGWMATLSWQAGSAGGSFMIGSLIQGCLIVYRPTYAPQRWQGTLFVFATAAVEGIVNIFLVQWLPWLQTLMIFPHGFGWIAVIAFLGVLAPKATAHDVFLNFQSNGGWEPMGLSLMVGQITSVYFLICTCT